MEFSLTAVLFLMTVLGVMEFGLAVFRYNMLSDLAQEGARYATVRGSGAGAIAATESDIGAFVSARAVGIGTTTKVFSVDATTKACTTTEVDPSALNSGSGVCVQVAHTFTPVTAIVPLGSITLSSTAQMIMAR